MRITAIALGLVLGGTVPVVSQEEHPGAPHEGIKVHGHWTIEVRNPDGSLASRHVFENALQANGAEFLASRLSGALSPFTWRVVLSNSDPNERPCLLVDAPWACIVDPAAAIVPSAAPGTVELSGFVTARRNGSIASVESYTQYPIMTFSARDLSTAVPVSAGQIIQFKVVFSFS
jgi:hypothetical protein